MTSICAENGAKEILACFLKKTGQVLKKISSVSKETGVFRWDQNDLPVGPQSVSGGIGMASWSRQKWSLGVHWNGLLVYTGMVSWCTLKWSPGVHWNDK